MSVRIESGAVAVSTETCRDRQSQLEILIDRHRDRILLYVFSLVQDSHAAEDICQRSCIVMWRKFEEYDATRDFLAWACGIARFEVLNHRRSQASEPLQFSSDVMHLLGGTLREIECRSEEDRLGALKRCVQKLSSSHQTMLSRVYADGCDCETIATELGCTLRTIYNRMYLVRRQLLACIQRRVHSSTNNAYSILMNDEEENDVAESC